MIPIEGLASGGSPVVEITFKRWSNMFANGSATLLPVVTALFLSIILAPLAAMLVQFAISRTREYKADAIGAEICEDPLALASALDKISTLGKRIDNDQAEANPATAHLFIANPLHVRSIDSLFSTHPNTEARIRLLQAMAVRFAPATSDHDDGAGSNECGSNRAPNGT